MTKSSNIRAPLSEEVINSLSRAGVGAKFHDRRIPDYGEEAKFIEEWVKGTKSEFRDKIVIDGKGISFSGTSPKVPHLFEVLARGCVLCGVQTKVVDLTTLIKLLNSSQEAEVQYFNYEALFVRDFYDADMYEKIPPNIYDVRSLLRERLYARKSVFTLCSGVVTDQDIKKLWGMPLIEDLKQINDGFKVCR